MRLSASDKVLGRLKCITNVSTCAEREGMTNGTYGVRAIEIISDGVVRVEHESVEKSQSDALAGQQNTWQCDFEVHEGFGDAVGGHKIGHSEHVLAIVQQGQFVRLIKCSRRSI